MPEVVIHVGAFKTGTTFIQAGISGNRVSLGEAGVLVPSGGRAAQAEAVGALLRRFRAGGGASRPDAWDHLVDEACSWNGRLVVVSSEFLSTAQPAAVRAAVTSFEPHPVRIILGARDIERSLPAQWQESLQGGSGHVWTLTHYAANAMAAAPRVDEASQHFWRRHNWYRVLRRWGAHVPRERLGLMTVPAPGAPRTELWYRFGAAAGFDAEPHSLPNRQNESLGAASLEVLRRLNEVIRSRGLPPSVDPKLLKRVLATRVLARRRDLESSVVFPAEFHQDAVRHTDRLVGKLRSLGCTVTGDLEELTPRSVPSRPGQTSAPEHTSAEELLAATTFATDRLNAYRTQTHSLPQPRTVDEAVEGLYTLVTSTLTRR